jgi:hypothetical protein
MFDYPTKSSISIFSRRYQMNDSEKLAIEPRYTTLRAVRLKH